MIKFKTRSVTNSIIVQYSNTGEADIKLRDLRHKVKLAGELEVKANYVISIDGTVEVARSDEQVSGIGDDTIVIIVVGDYLNEVQTETLTTLKDKLIEKFGEISVLL